MCCNIVQKIKDQFGFKNNQQKKGYFITATDTNVGKSYCSALFMQAFDAYYFKPIQAGDLETGGDTGLVQKLSGLPQHHFLKPIYNLKYPRSPHEAMMLEGIEIDMNTITLPVCDKPLIVEGAGGVMTPLNNKNFMINVIKKFDLPVIIIVRSELGTLNHSLLTIQALRAYNIHIAGIIMNGQSMPNNLKSLQQFSGVDIILENIWG